LHTKCYTRLYKTSRLLWGGGERSLLYAPQSTGVLATGWVISLLVRFIGELPAQYDQSSSAVSFLSADSALPFRANWNDSPGRTLWPPSVMHTPLWSPSWCSLPWYSGSSAARCARAGANHTLATSLPLSSLWESLRPAHRAIFLPQAGRHHILSVPATMHVEGTEAWSRMDRGHARVSTSYEGGYLFGRLEISVSRWFTEGKQPACRCIDVFLHNRTSLSALVGSKFSFRIAVFGFFRYFPCTSSVDDEQRE